MKRETHAEKLSCLVMLTLLLAVTGARAQTVLRAGGSISLSDGQSPAGTRITLKVDLDDDGRFVDFERVTSVADASGVYDVSLRLDASQVSLDAVTYVLELIAKLESGGFEALIDRGPLTVALSFEKPGYSTIHHTFATNLGQVTFAARLAPLDEIFCEADTCKTPGDGVQLSGLLGDSGISAGYAKAYDPTKDGHRFPGTFTDAADNLLVSSGFIEVDLRDADDAPVTALAEPATVRFALDRASWRTLVDKVAGSGTVDVPMYSFDEGTAAWVSEGTGVLEDGNGQDVAENQLAAIRDGSFAGKLFVRFSTQHFSYWNVDEPVEAHACVKGRLVDVDGNALAGLSVIAAGVSYTGSAPGMTTAQDGFFAAGMMKSEVQGEDLDYDGVVGETFQAELQVAGQTGAFIGAAFDTPSTSSKIVDKGGISCVPQGCPCEDLGDVAVTLETPTLCEVTVTVTFNGQTESAVYDGQLEAGAALAGITVTGEMLGNSMPMPPVVAELCSGKACDGAVTDGAGTATFAIPEIGAGGTLRLEASYEMERADGDLDVYSGAVEIAGCAEAETAVAGEVALEVTHYVMADFFDFLADLFESGFVSGDADSDSEGGGGSGSGCLCGVSPGKSPRGLGLLGVALLLGLALLARRRR